VPGTSDAVVSGSLVVSELNGKKILIGVPSTSIVFKQLPSNFTLFTVARYADTGAQGRIFQGETGNWLFGFWNKQTGVSHYNKATWITGSVNIHNKSSWLISTSNKETYRSNGTDRTTNIDIDEPSFPVLTINKGQNENSDFMVAEVIIYKRKLTRTEMDTIENYLATKYSIPLTTVAPTCTADDSGWSPKTVVVNASTTKTCPKWGDQSTAVCNSDGTFNVTKECSNASIPPSFVLRGNYQGNNKICSAWDGEAKYLRCSRDNVGGPWEQFQGQDNGDGTVSFKNVQSQEWCSADDTWVRCNRGVIGNWEKFRLEPGANGKTFIKSEKSGQYLVSTGNETQYRSNNKLQYEEFTIQPI
jgi:hypothetical protein